MRVLERCIPSAAPEVKIQIDALRQAFSNDTSKEFELKPDLGLRSPSVESKPTPPAVYDVQPSNSLPPGGQAWQQLPDTLSSKTISPASEYGPSYQPPPVQPQMMSFNSSSSYSMPSQSAFAGLPQISTAPQTGGYPLETVMSNEQQTPVWDPSGIFREWNTAFGPPSQPQQTPPAQAMQQPPMMQPQQSPSSAQHVYSQQMPVQNMMPAVTPVMWQNAFTDAYVSGHGHKRYRDDGADGYGGYQKRRG